MSFSLRAPLKAEESKPNSLGQESECTPEQHLQLSHPSRGLQRYLHVSHAEECQQDGGVSLTSHQAGRYWVDKEMVRAMKDGDGVVVRVVAEEEGGREGQL